MKFPSLIVASIAWVFASTANAGYDVTPAQAKTLCRVVDPVFLNALPVLLEMKASGKSQRQVRLAYLYGTNYGIGIPFMTRAVEAIHDSSETTVDGAIRFLEERCFKELTE